MGLLVSPCRSLHSAISQQKRDILSAEDMNEEIQTIYDDDRKQRIVIFRRKNGSFGFTEEYFSEPEFEMCWIELSRSASFFGTLEIALREVYGRVDWLIGKETPQSSQ